MGLCKLTEYILQTDTRIIMTLSCSHMALAHNTDRWVDTALSTQRDIIMPNFLYLISVLDNYSFNNDLF